MAESGMLPFFPRHLYLTIQEDRAAVDRIFGRLGFDPVRLHDSSFRLSRAQHRQLLVSALEVTRDPYLPVRLAELELGTAHVAFMAIANAGRVSKALAALVRYQKIVTRAVTVWPLELSRGGATMEVDADIEDERAARFALSWTALVIDRLFRRALGGSHLVRRLELPGRPKSDLSFEEGFGFPVTFGHPPARIHIDPTQLDVMLPQADSQTLRIIEEACEQLLDAAAAETGWASQVQALVRNQLGAPPRLDEAAHRLGVSSRSLCRKLRGEGLTYQAVLDDVRRDRAVELLEGTEQPIKLIADQLGFASPSHFGRAFRKWTGHCPSKLRADGEK
ncbi:MAG: helix-turn-helix domain-containing protein [Myxococcota bacterium]